MDISPLLKKDFDLTPYTTFGIPAKARLFAEYTSVRQLTAITRSREWLDNDVLHIGGGSNLLMLSDFDGLVLHSGIKGITRYDSSPDKVYVIAGAGEKWTDLVDWCVAEGLGGLENMAGIPGEVGASAVQNVGAYGVEAKDVIFAVECFDVSTRETVRLTAEECGFGYRDSRFKHDWKWRYYVLRVSFRLTPSVEARNLSYGPLAALRQRLGHTPTIEEVKREVEMLRNAKLPDPASIGSAGSFFKNPVVSRGFFESEIARFNPDIPYHETSDGHLKLSAAWLIDHAGLKGARVGGAEVWTKQPLVIANTGCATAHDVAGLADKIRRTVKETFGVSLTPEVNYIDSRIDITILGSGTSKGVPEVGCRCRVCRSSDKADKRRRASVYVRTHGLSLLIDASPDLRQQLLDNNIDRIDAVLVTHDHADHIGGFDDLRPFCYPAPLPVFLRDDVEKAVRTRFDYCFLANPYPGAPQFKLQTIDNGEFIIDGLRIEPVEVLHGTHPIFGYRIGAFAYITDAKTIEEDELEKLHGLKLLIINALRDKDHFAHLTINEALALIERLRPEKVLLTHLNHEAGTHQELMARLRSFTVRTGIEVAPAFDGQHITVQ